VSEQAIFRYNEFIVNVLWQIKHNRDIHLIRGFYPFIRAYVRKTYDLAHTVFVPIPTNKATLRRRRFNLIECVFQELQLPITVCPLFMMSDEANVKQHTLGRNERLAASKQRFVCDKIQLKVFKGNTWQKIVIVDDVYTTGATVMKAIKSLPHVEQDKVCSFTLFR
jgi:competence protein ComFC